MKACAVGGITMHQHYYIGAFLLLITIDRSHVIFTINNSIWTNAYLLWGIILILFVFIAICYLFATKSAFMQMIKQLAPDEKINRKHPKQSLLNLYQNLIKENETLKSQLEIESKYDRLTKCYNRFTYESDLVKVDHTKDYPIALLMIDINSLKLINDSFGDVAGDFIIKGVAEIIKNTFKNEVVYRIGGDEFIVLIKRAETQKIEQKKIEIVSQMKKLTYQNVNLTLSFGYDFKNTTSISFRNVQRNAENYLYRAKIISRKTSRTNAVDTIMQTLYEKSAREQAHSIRVSNMCKKVANQLGLSHDRINEIEIAGMLHDIGKIAIEAKILNKPAKLDKREWLEIKRHPVVGYNILNTIDELKMLAQWILAHHERWDGTGYPVGLKGDDIPFESRIIAIVDAYDAMTEDRTYRDPLSKKDALHEIYKNAGTQFDPKLVDVFIQMIANEFKVASSRLVIFLTFIYNKNGD
jgi:diguanylate cyclase (GGDEF)-like protein